MAQAPKSTARPTAPAQKQAPKPAAQATKPAQAQTATKTAPAQAARPANPTPQAGQQQTRTTAVVERQTTALATNQDIPEHIRQSQGRGSENVEMQDMVIPRIEQVQALSHCLEEGGAEYIEGAKPGMFYNSVTRELYGNSLNVIPVFFKKQWLAWKDRKRGGGFGGAYDSLVEANDRIAQEANDQDAWEPVETAQQILLVVNPETQETTEAVLSCARSKMKVSRQWNSLIRVAGFDRFSRVYELFSVDDENNNGDKYKNLGVRLIDFASVPAYKAAEALYNSINSGDRVVKVDDSYIDIGMGSEDSTPAGVQRDDSQSEY